MSVHPAPQASGVDRARLADCSPGNRAVRRPQPGSAAAYQGGSLFGRVPMTWMNMAAGGFPLYLDRASGARVTDVDGQEYADFSLGDTAAMAGHPPPRCCGLSSAARPGAAGCR